LPPLSRFFPFLSESGRDSSASAGNYNEKQINANKTSHGSVINVARDVRHTDFVMVLAFLIFYA
jgi:hypothetical protein